MNEFRKLMETLDRIVEWEDEEDEMASSEELDVLEAMLRKVPTERLRKYFRLESEPAVEKILSAYTKKIGRKVDFHDAVGSVIYKRHLAKQKPVSDEETYPFNGADLNDPKTMSAIMSGEMFVDTEFCNDEAIQKIRAAGIDEVNDPNLGGVELDHLYR